MRTRTKCLIVLIVLMVIDALPVPVLGLLALQIILSRPPWFRELVQKLYEEK
ncbi:MAG TPA: hypothetical protein VLU73_07155 [Methylococcaceae bacterium]|jgi:hypothetical protein|nr:hypothetical protein [Methylococcaceae bacterium]